MTSIFKTPHGEMNQFIQNLHSMGFTYEDVLKVNRDPNRAHFMHEAMNLEKPAITHVLAKQPAWYVKPMRQLARARRLWPDIDLPDPPEVFVRENDSEVLLLHVPDTFDSLWEKFVAPIGYVKSRADDVVADRRHLCLAPNTIEYDEPVWLGFDPIAHQGEAPEDVWGQSNLAASEVLSALIQFPEWVASWNGTDSPYPNLVGYKLKYDNRIWSCVPHLLLSDDRRLIALDSGSADIASEGWAAPTVRRVA